MQVCLLENKRQTFFIHINQAPVQYKGKTASQSGYKALEKNYQLYLKKSQVFHSFHIISFQLTKAH